MTTTKAGTIAAAEQWMDALERGEIESVVVEDTSDLSRIALAADRAAQTEREVRKLVAQARTNGRSWTEIGHALGVSRQAARQRFGHRVPA